MAQRGMYIVLQYIPHTDSYCIVLLSTCIFLYNIELYCTMLYRTLQYSTVLYYTILYCIVLYSTLQYCTISYCTLLYCIVRCSTVMNMYPSLMCVGCNYVYNYVYKSAMEFISKLKTNLTIISRGVWKPYIGKSQYAHLISSAMDRCNL